MKLENQAEHLLLFVSTDAGAVIKVDIINGLQFMSAPKFEPGPKTLPAVQEPVLCQW
jgi:hypothetical protein